MTPAMPTLRENIAAGAGSNRAPRGGALPLGNPGRAAIIARDELSRTTKTRTLPKNLPAARANQRDQ